MISYAPVHLCERCLRRHKNGACDQAHERGLTPPLKGPCGDHAWHEEHGESVADTYGELVGMCRPHID